MEHKSADASEPAPSSGARQQPPKAALDLQRLADKVYQLMLAEARLVRARGMKRRER